MRGGARVEGLTTTYGNAALSAVHPIAEDLGQRYEVPVFRGASAPGDVDTAAVERLVAHRGAVLAIGPCTNIAAALARGAKWSQLILLGGTFDRSPNVRYLHLTELNFALDAPAAALALQACSVVFTMELCRKLVFHREDLAPLPPDLQARCESWLRIAPRLTGTDGFHPWDLIPALFILDPAPFTLQRQQLRLITRWPRRGVLCPGPVDLSVAVEFRSDALVQQWRSLV